MTSRAYGPRKGGGRVGSNDTSAGTTPEHKAAGVDAQRYTSNTPNGKGRVSVPLNRRR